MKTQKHDPPKVQSILNSKCFKMSTLVNIENVWCIMMFLIYYGNIEINMKIMKWI
jgi:hypothetical protein